MSQRYTSRLARMADIDALTRLMNRAIEAHLAQFLTARQVHASFDIMGLDTQLIEDGTYFAILDGDAIVGSGGWSYRATLYGGDHTTGRSARRLDPATEAARIRAMYVDPRHARRGLGRRILDLCEDAARQAGFTQAELVATAAGRPLYLACGYKAERDYVETTPSGVDVPLWTMRKALVGDGPAPCTPPA